MEVTKFSWYPGHMKKSTELIFSMYKQVDLFIEVLDARALNTSHNDELSNKLHQKMISIALKSDLAAKVNPQSHVLVTNIYETNFVNKVLNFIEAKLSYKKQIYYQKGVVNPQFNLMIVGLPNIGKSTLINRLVKNRNILIANQPGVTKKIARFKINNYLLIYDTPGVWFKRVDNFNVGAKLALINTVKHEILPIYDLVKFAYEYWLWFDFQQMANFFDKTMLANGFDCFLNKYCQFKKFLLPGQQLDIDRCLQYVFKLFISGKIGLVNYDYPTFGK